MYKNNVAHNNRITLSKSFSECSNEKLYVQMTWHLLKHFFKEARSNVFLCICIYILYNYSQMCVKSDSSAFYTSKMLWFSFPAMKNEIVVFSQPAAWNLSWNYVSVKTDNGSSLKWLWLHPFVKFRATIWNWLLRKQVRTFSWLHYWVSCWVAFLPTQ